MTTTDIENRIESEPLNIHSPAYSWHRDFLASHLADELESGDPVAFAREFLAASRRAVLHELQALGAPDESIARAFAILAQP